MKFPPIKQFQSRITYLAVDCYWGPWVYHAECVFQDGKACGDGMETATRSEVIHSAYPGKACEGNRSKIEACTIKCPGEHCVNKEH